MATVTTNKKTGKVVSTNAVQRTPAQMARIRTAGRKNARANAGVRAQQGANIAVKAINRTSVNQGGNANAY